ncbi:MAG: NAD-dependent deacylase [Chitinophagales bacterium]|nr:NAD-dependent deacylase [Chitinophagales bacterium]
MKKVVVLTGAGISAESGLSTFRDAGGLWEGHNVYEVASPAGWAKNPSLVLDFYNQRRRQLLEAKPNAAHVALAELGEHFRLNIITQNVDDLHERGGAKNVLHLHGELLKARSTRYPHLVYDWREDIHIGDTCEKGSQLRPHIVWFGEQVHLMERAVQLTIEADIFIVVGTSLNVYPAASLIDYVGFHKPKYIVDPILPEGTDVANLHFIQKRATEGVPMLVEELILHAKMAA